MQAKLAELEQVLDEVRAGGGERYVQRHRERGKLLASGSGSSCCWTATRRSWSCSRSWPTAPTTRSAARWWPASAPVEGVECVIGGADPTVRGGTSNPHTWRKALRMMEVAEVNRMPMVQLVESGGADLRTQAEGFIPGGETFRNITKLSALGIPSLALVFGNSTAGGAYLPGMSDYNIFVRERAKVFLGGPPLVKMATGEVSEDEELGGADMHARVSGLAEYLANDEHDALRLGREVVRRLNWRKHGYGADRAARRAGARPRGAARASCRPT